MTTPAHDGAPSNSNEAKSSQSTVESLLDSSLFQQAVLRYLDEFKSDPLAKRQVQDLHVEWTNHDGEDSNVVELDQQQQQHDLLSDASSTPRHSICGTLELVGENMVVRILARCSYWKGNTTSPGGTSIESNNATTSTENNKESSSVLWFQLVVADVRFLSKSQIKKREPKKDNKKQERIANKIRAGMIARLRSDHYIKQLLEEEQQPLCVAVICSSSDAKIREERVNVEEDVVEGVRRAILSQSDGPCAVMEFLLSMPYLVVDNDDKTCCARDSTLLLLAQRAKLRLLEDAMLDACEKEGEDELLDDLDISEQHYEEQQDDTEEDQVQTAKRQKPR